MYQIIINENLFVTLSGNVLLVKVKASMGGIESVIVFSWCCKLCNCLARPLECSFPALHNLTVPFLIWSCFDPFSVWWFQGTKPRQFPHNSALTKARNILRIALTCYHRPGKLSRDMHPMIIIVYIAITQFDPPLCPLYHLWCFMLPACCGLKLDSYRTL